MKFFSIFTTICLAGTALACANGPYDTGSACSGDCVGLTRCGDDNHVVSINPPYSEISFLFRVVIHLCGAKPSIIDSMPGRKVDCHHGLRPLQERRLHLDASTVLHMDIVELD